MRRQAVLTALVLRPGVLVSQEQLLDAVWGEYPPKTGRSVLPSYVYALRKTLGHPVPIHSGQGGYRFVADGVRLDVAELAEWLDGAQRAREAEDLDAALGLFSKALDLFHGEPLTGLPGPFAEAERRRLSTWREAASARRASSSRP
ncbi:AfsR/SARP family transcriptional regulator [Streptomyces sp. NBC_00576]|uniref:AfsR/SARP family transcriptional regulator n=1 Tax=Streptomyces sp. NBC_00576 TaxID=2903665 RepID=UPI002E80D762|nr:winged helix-turn-helix domain-containing protein [Streptomyces sp. NBC_00576]WUB72124.1 winged helix-turn-helix domain-containing protein [Streptomyces sp. NBC_00576]